MVEAAEVMPLPMEDKSIEEKDPEIFALI